jgi:hypothetical protein
MRVRFLPTDDSARFEVHLEVEGHVTEVFALTLTLTEDQKALPAEALRRLAVRRWHGMRADLLAAEGTPEHILRALRADDWVIV